MAVVCNLIFNTPLCVAINASSPGIADGQIIVSALDGSNPATVKYNLNSDFTYPFGQTSGTFSGLLPGTYTVYARNSTSCRATIVLIVGYVSEYAIRYRLPFKDPYDNQYKLEIEDSEYESATVNELIGRGEAPVRIVHRGESNEDVFYHVVSSLIEVSIISLTDQQYIDFYTFDERRFRAKVYKWNGSSYDLYHVGYLTPMLYSEPYVLKEGYEINLVFTDGLADLKDYEFTDDSGNIPQDRIPIFNALNYIINKTDIALNIWESVNIYASVMDSGTDDSMLEQAYIDPKNYLNDDGSIKNCAEVLAYLLDFMGAKLYQSNGRWNIDLVSEKTATEVPYRKRTSNYGVIAGGNENPRYLLRRSTAASPRITFKDQSQVMRIPHTWGTIELTYEFGLRKNNSLIIGDFENEDLENGQLRNWQVEAGADTIIGLERLEESRAGLAFFTQHNTNVFGTVVTITSKPVPIYETDFDSKIKFSFDTYIRPIFENTYSYIDVAISIGNKYLKPVRPNWTDPRPEITNQFTSAAGPLIDGKYIRYYIDELLKWKTIEVEALVKGSNGVFGDLVLEFKLYSPPTYDYETIALMKAAGIPELYKRRARVKDTISSKDVIRFYEHEYSSESESLPDIVSLGSNQIWKLKKTVEYPKDSLANPFNSWVQSIMIDNVYARYFPAFDDPESNYIVTEVPNEKIKQVFEKTAYHGDLLVPPLDDNYSNIMTGHLTESDGTPIYGGWFRKGVTENYNITQLLAKMMRGQYQERRWMLTGEVMCPDGMLSFWNTIHEVRTGKIYQLISLVQNLKEGFAEIESIETLSGGDPLDESTDPGGDPGPIEPPVETRVHSSDFSTDFN